MPYRSQVDPNFNWMTDQDIFIPADQVAAVLAPKAAPVNQTIVPDGVDANGNYYRDVNGVREYKWDNAFSGWTGTSYAAPGEGTRQYVWSANQPDISLAEKTPDGRTPSVNPFGLATNKSSDFLTGSDLAMIGGMAAIPFGVGAMTGAAGMAGGTYGGLAGFEAAGSAAAGASGAGGAAAYGAGGTSPALTGAYEASVMDPMFANYTGATAPQGINVPGYGSVYGGQYATGALKDALQATAAGKNLFGTPTNAPGGTGTTPGKGGTINLPGIGDVPLSLLGALGGGALGYLGANGDPAGYTTTVQDIPAWLKPYAEEMLKSGQATFNQSTKSPLIPAAEAEMLKTIQGGYLDSNPYLDQTYQRGAEQIKSNLSPSFGHMQAFGSNTGYNQAYGRSLADLATGLYGGNYQTERGRQFAATTGAPDFNSSATTSAFAPHQAYKSLMNFGGGTQTSPYFQNNMAGAAGGALAGYTMSRMFG
jgi:hypothetical protein